MHLFAVLKEQIKNQVYLYLQVEGPPQNHAHSGDLGFIFFMARLLLTLPSLPPIVKRAGRNHA